MADTYRACGLLTVARGWERKDQRDIGAELRLVLFDDRGIVALLFHNGLGHMPLGQQGVHRAYSAWQNEMVQDCLYLRDLIGFVVHACWASVRPKWWDRADNRWTPGAPCLREPRSVLPSRATAASPADGATGVLTTTPSAQAPRRFHGVAVYVPKELCSVAAHTVCYA